VPNRDRPKSSGHCLQELRRSRFFEEPLVPIGAAPTPAENAALAVSLTNYSLRAQAEDFSHLTTFIKDYPHSPWNAALLLNLGLEYFRTGRYSKTVEVWRQAWDLGQAATDPHGKALADRAFGELVQMHARLGQMAELDAMLVSAGDRVFVGPATREGHERP
jgi:hypothetical protein